MRRLCVIAMTFAVLAASALAQETKTKADKPESTKCLYMVTGLH